MQSESVQTRRPVTLQGGRLERMGSNASEQDQLPCPRCYSTKTKFCYYNNYNFSQPRHFCKSCRRYWTHGGTLRDIPVGGGSRKSSKRSRTCSTQLQANGAVVNLAAGSPTAPLPATPAFLSGSFVQLGGGQVKGSVLSPNGSLTSLLNSNPVAFADAKNGPDGFHGLSGFGLGLGSSLEEIGFEPGRVIWPFFVTGDGAACLRSNSGPAAPVPAKWQLDSLENSARLVASGDCFTWPELAVSTPGSSLK